MAIRERPAGPTAPTELISPPPPGPPEEPPPERELWPWLLVVLLLLLAGLAAAWYATRDSGGGAAPRTRLTTVAAAPKKQTTTRPEVATVVVPDLVGQTRDDAVHTLEAQSLKASVHEVPSTEDRDTVVSQSPAGGTKVDQDSTVLLNVSNGPKATAPTTTAPATVTVPDVTGQALDSAESTLRATGFEASVQHVPSTEPKDIVVSQSPGGGSTAQQGAHVLLNVSSGEETKAKGKEKAKSQQPAAASVPSVIGEDETTARADLIDAGLTPATVYQDTADPTQDGVVVDQTPTGGSSAPENSRVTIYVGRYNGG